ncbi:alanine--tRNA ligase [[Eubacterium] cellulosolvens]
MQIKEDEFSIPFFLENGFTRRKCEHCQTYYWTQDSTSNNCGDSPCHPYTFIGSPPTKKSYTITEMRDKFIQFFKDNGHTPISPYPVIARWRNDVYLVGASIFDFQPYVTEGILPPPANPLVVSQPCLRFTDLDNVGPTAGRHLVIFEMGGAHAFNYPEKKVYWKDETIRFHHELLTKELGLKSEAISYKEHFWSGGGNAGPDVEACVAGLEVSTLVFMSYKTSNGSLHEMPIKTVDTGYGIERWAWLSQGSPSGFHAIYPELIDKLIRQTGIQEDRKLIAETTKLSGMMNFETSKDKIEARRSIAKAVGLTPEKLESHLKPLEYVYAIADHTKALAFMLAEAVIPSNVEEGYLARLLIRRSLRMLKLLGIENQLPEIIDFQINQWSQGFPQLKEMRNEIIEALTVEEEKYTRTISRGAETIKKISHDLVSKDLKSMPEETLIELYDSHGIVPEIVAELARDISVKIPDNFFSIVAQRHIAARPSEESPIVQRLKDKVAHLPATRLLYYEDEKLTSFTAQTLAVIEDYVILDQTCFYPEGGGQVADTGDIQFNKTKAKVVDVQKIGSIIVHLVEGPTPQAGVTVKGTIESDRRRSLMRHHTATHILIGSARRVLGEHAWQAGAKKEADKSRLDISHYRHLTQKEVEEIERTAIRAVTSNLPVNISWMPRQEAEKEFGFRIYQGGAVPGKEIRIVNIKGWDVEACGGTHCSRTGEVGIIKILKVERPQDGVERLIFATGEQALHYIQEKESILHRVTNLVNAPIEKLPDSIEEALTREKECRKILERSMQETAQKEAVKAARSSKDVDGVKLVCIKKDRGDEKTMILLSSQITEIDPSAVSVIAVKDPTARVFVAAGSKAQKKGIHAGRVSSELAKIIGGGGGGRPYFGQGGGTNPERVDEAIQKAEKIVKGQLKP